MSGNNHNRRQTLGPVHFNTGGGLSASQPDGAAGPGGKPARLPAGPGARAGGGRYSMAPWASTGFGGGGGEGGGLGGLGGSQGGSQNAPPSSSTLLDAAGGARRSSVYVHPSTGMGGHKGGSGVGATTGGLAAAAAASGLLRADPRPVASRDFQESCIRALIAFLCARGYPHALSPKLLRSPTAKDFALVAQFLAARFDPSYAKQFGRPEDEVPALLKRLGYPFQVPKSALFAVGSPHSWPSVLAALAWLVELLTYEERAEQALLEQERRDNAGLGGGGGGGGAGGGGAGHPSQSSSSCPTSVRRPGMQMSAADDVTMSVDPAAAAQAAAEGEGEGKGGENGDDAAGPDAFDAAEARARGERRFFRYVSSAYRHFLSGDDASVAAADAAMSAAFAKRRAAAEQAAREAAEGAAESAREAAALRSAPSPLQQAAARRDACAADRAKLEQALEQQRQAKIALEKKQEERAADALARKAQREELEREAARLKAVVAAQALSRADVGRLLAERAAAKEALEAACAQREQVEARCAQEELALEAKCAALEEALRPYHATARRLALAPLAAKRAGGVRFEVGDGGGGGGAAGGPAAGAAAATAAAADANNAASSSSSGIVDRHADDVVGMLRGVDPKGAVRPALARLRENYRQRARELAQDALSLGEALAAAEEGAAERGEEAAAAEASLKRLEAAHKELKGALDADVAAAGGQADRIAQEAAAVRARVGKSVAESERKAEQAARELEKAREKCAAEAGALSRQLNAALGAALTHRLDVKGALEGAQQAVAAVVAAVSEGRGSAGPLPAAG